MLVLAFFVALGGFFTIGFAFSSMNKVAPGGAKQAAKAALAHVQQASKTAVATSTQYQEAMKEAVTNPSDDKTRALQAAAMAQPEANKSLVESIGALKELLVGLGTVFQDLGALSPPIAALCIAVLMFLTAGGIAVANELIN
jgi:hypothetical protein